jgi:hypothetical protein
MKHDFAEALGAGLPLLRARAVAHRGCCQKRRGCVHWPVRTRWPTRPAVLIDTINVGVRATDPLVSVRRIATMLVAG